MSKFSFSKIYIPILFISVSILFYLFFNGQKKLAYIDAMKIYSKYKGIEKAKGEFAQEVEFFKSRTDTLSAKVKISILKLEQVKLSTLERQKIKDSIDFFHKQLLNYQSSMESSLKEKESALTQKALKTFNVFLKEYGEKHNYDIILIANPSGTIGFAKDEYDITDEVIREANEKL